MLCVYTYSYIKNTVHFISLLHLMGWESIIHWQSTVYTGVHAGHRRRIKTETQKKSKGRRCCMGDRIASIPCRTSYFALCRTISRIDWIAITVNPRKQQRGPLPTLQYLSSFFGALSRSSGWHPRRAEGSFACGAADGQPTSTFRQSRKWDRNSKKHCTGPVCHEIFYWITKVRSSE